MQTIGQVVLRFVGQRPRSNLGVVLSVAASWITGGGEIESERYHKYSTKQIEPSAMKSTKIWGTGLNKNL